MKISLQKYKELQTMQIEFCANTNSNYTVFNPKNKKVYNCSYVLSKKMWTCDCWWFANRVVVNKDKWKYCKHILAILFLLDKKNFEKNI